jgi:hypothetical protein
VTGNTLGEPAGYTLVIDGQHVDAFPEHGMKPSTPTVTFLGRLRPTAVQQTSTRPWQQPAGLSRGRGAR